MTATSLSLLKGGAKAALVEELKKPEPEPVAQVEGDEVSFDIDTMTADEIDSLVSEQQIEVPDDWAERNRDAKVAWLNEQFGETDGETEAVAVEDAAPAEPVKAPAKAKKEPKPKADKKEKSTAVAKPEVVAEAKTGEFSKAGDDPLVDMIFEIENVKNKDDALSAVHDLIDQADTSFFKIGGFISLIQANKWYEPYSTVREYVENELGLEYRKAMYWSAIYNDLAEASIPWEKIKAIAWSKLKEITSIINKDNVDEWVELAAKSTVLTLHEAVKSYKNKDKQLTDETSSKTVTTKTFKVHDGQKEVIESAIAKAKEASNTTVDTVALETICLEYLGSISLKERLVSAGVDKAIEALGAAFPDVNFSVTLPEDEAA